MSVPQDVTKYSCITFYNNTFLDDSTYSVGVKRLGKVYGEK